MTHAQKKRIQQRIIGLVFILLSIGMAVLAASGSSFEDRDGGAVVLLLPLGLWLLFSRRIVIH